MVVDLRIGLKRGGKGVGFGCLEEGKRKGGRKGTVVGGAYFGGEVYGGSKCVVTSFRAQCDN